MILLRHGQSAFNVVYSSTKVDPGIRDPGLTELGRRQADEATQALAGRAVRRVVTSPYSRALETAEIIATALTLPVTVEPLVRERRLFVCDIGSPRSEIAERWPGFDFDRLDEVWWPSATESESALLARCARFRELAAAWPDRDQVVVISHWGFISALTGVSAHNAEIVPFEPR